MSGKGEIWGERSVRYTGDRGGGCSRHSTAEVEMILGVGMDKWRKG